jgi:hypothetical protein
MLGARPSEAFPSTKYHRCRECRGKLDAPAETDALAFCSRECHRRFYLRHCLVCEREKSRKSPSTYRGAPYARWAPARTRRWDGLFADEHELGNELAPTVACDKLPSVEINKCWGWIDPRQERLFFGLDVSWRN